MKNKTEQKKDLKSNEHFSLYLHDFFSFQFFVICLKKNKFINALTILTFKDHIYPPGLRFFLILLIPITIAAQGLWLSKHKVLPIIIPFGASSAQTHWVISLNDQIY